MNSYTSPPRIEPTVKSAPRIRQVYWCDFPKDAQLPEFWKKRPVIVVSRKSSLYGVVTVVPITSQQPKDMRDAVEFVSPFSRDRSWAICNYVTTVAVSRLSASKVVPRIDQDIFDKVAHKMLANLPVG